MENFFEKVNNSGFKDYKDYNNVLGRNLKKYLGELGCTEIKISKGYNQISGFFTTAKNEIYYFGHTYNPGNTKDNMGMFIIRKAKDYKDFKGEHNVFISMTNCNNFTNGIFEEII